MSRLKPIQSQELSKFDFKKNQTSQNPMYFYHYILTEIKEKGTSTDHKQKSKNSQHYLL